MANICVRIMVGKKSNGDFECGREYNFSIGKEDTKMPSSTMLDIIEDAIDKRLYDTFGNIKAT